MHKSGGSSFLDTLAKQFKRFAGALKEKPQVKLDDYVLEHFMHYHGLAGTTEESQIKFRNVRRDLFDALQNKSSAEAAIALKVEPLYWQERLEQIFDAATEEFAKPVLLQCLLPPATDAIDKSPEHVPLMHPDWRVRANAAKVLAHSKFEEAIPNMVDALHETSKAQEQRSAFMHIAYALAQTQTEEAKQALLQHLDDDEHWFRVDAAGALATWPLPDVRVELLSAMLRPHVLNDYMSVAISRQHSINQLLEPVDNANARQGALEVVIGLVQAASGPFANEVGRDPMMFEIMDIVANTATQGEFSPRGSRAALLLADWIIQSVDSFRIGADERMLERAVELAKETQTRLISDEQSQNALRWLETNSENPVDLKHALDLAARFKLREAAPYVIPLLKPHHPSINEGLDAAGALGLVEAVPAIIAVVQQTVDMNDRTSRPLSKQPVFEEDASGAKTYWHALKALGNLRSEEAYQLLLKATSDYASDKRQQALLSLITQITGDDEEKHKTAAAEAIGRMLADPASSVRIAALQGIGRLKLVGLLAETAKLAGAKDTGVSRAAVNAMKELAEAGYGQQVKWAVDAELSGERDLYRRQRLEGLSRSLE